VTRLLKAAAIGLTLTILSTLTQAAESLQGPRVILHTNHGDITLTLDREKAPVTVANFEGYVKSGFYNNLIFHRVIDGFMIQGGGFKSNLIKKSTDAPIKNEADNGLSNLIGTIAMARTPDPHSATAQFFININDNLFLDHSAKTSNGWGYAVFGKVTQGMEVVNAIKGVPTSQRGRQQNVPVQDVLIESAEWTD
jgi:peptidyl-prolyl cis-trans isomerase B (cyclophilin B)